MNRRWDVWTLRIDGVWLATMGGIAVLADLAGYFAGKGPFAGEHGDPIVIGQLEAHGLAVIVGYLIARSGVVATLEGRHAIAIATHTLLGAANLTFFSMFAKVDALAMGYATTAFHGLFALVNLVALYGKTPHMYTESDIGEHNPDHPVESGGGMKMKRIIGAALALLGITGVAMTSDADVTGIPCTKTRIECESSVKTLFTNLGCDVSRVWCSGRPPPPGGTTGDYTCTVVSSNCTTIDSNTTCDGTTADALGFKACKAPSIATCNRPAAGNTPAKCEMSRPLYNGDCRRGAAVANKPFQPLGKARAVGDAQIPDGFDKCEPTNEDPQKRYNPVCETIAGKTPFPDQMHGARDRCVWTFDGPCSGANVPNCQ